MKLFEKIDNSFIFLFGKMDFILELLVFIFVLATIRFMISIIMLDQELNNPLYTL